MIRLPRARLQNLRGFTLLEVMATVAIIGVLVAIGTPKMVLIIKDRRVEEVTKNVGRTFTAARVRAMGRGTATLFRYQYQGLGKSPVLDVRESVDPSGLPSGSCFAANWANNSPTSRGLSTLDTGSGDFDVEFLDQNDSPQNFVELCFTPHGRTFIRYASGGVFSPITYVPRVRVTNKRTDRERVTFLPATGVGRIQL